MTKPSNVTNLIAQMVANGLLPEGSAAAAQALANNVTANNNYEVIIDEYVVELLATDAEANGVNIFDTFQKAKQVSRDHLLKRQGEYKQAIKDLKEVKKAAVDADKPTTDLPEVTAEQTA